MIVADKNFPPCVTSYAWQMGHVTSNVTGIPRHLRKFPRSSLCDDAVTAQKNEGFPALLGDAGSKLLTSWLSVREQAERNLQFWDSHRLSFGTGSGVQKGVKPMAVNSLLFPQGWTFQIDPKRIFKISQPWPHLLHLAPASPMLSTHAIFRVFFSENIHSALKFPEWPCQGGNCLNNSRAIGDRVKISCTLVC